MRVIENTEQKARGAYAAYAKAMKGRDAYNGSFLHVWDGLPSAVREAWEAAVISVCIAEQDAFREKKIG